MKYKNGELQPKERTDDEFEIGRTVPFKEPLESQDEEVF